MAVLLAEEHWQGRSSKYTLQERTHTRVFRIQADDKHQSSSSILTHVGINIGEQHPNDILTFCTEASVASENASPWWSLATYTYSSKWELAENPINDPAVITWTTEQYQEPLVYDNDHKAVLNSAGDPFDPPYMKDQSRRVCKIIKNVASVPAWFLDYEDAINSDTPTVDGVVLEEGKWKCQRPSIGKKEYRNGTAFREVQLELHYSKRGWSTEILDAGFRQITVTGVTLAGLPAYTRSNILTHGQKPTSPVPLNGSGVPIAEPSLSNAVFREFDTYTSLPFSALPLS